MIGIYKITNPKEAIYIGQSIGIEKRFKQYSKIINCKLQPKLYNSFIKYGVINHKFEVIEECDFDLLNERERYWQEFYNSIKGLNCNYVSTKTKKQFVSIEIRKKMSKSGKGKTQSKQHVINRVNSKKGYIHSENTKDKIRLKRNKLILDLFTGIFYENSIEASKAKNINLSTLRAMLVNRLKNKTTLIYA